MADRWKALGGGKSTSTNIATLKALLAEAKVAAAHGDKFRAYTLYLEAIEALMGLQGGLMGFLGFPGRPLGVGANPKAFHQRSVV